MKGINIIFPHQLFQTHVLYENGYDIYMIEEPLFFSQYKFHKMKLAYHRATMKAHASYLESKGLTVYYIEVGDQRSDLGHLLGLLSIQKIEVIYLVDPTDYWLEKRIKQAALQQKIKLTFYENPIFINTRSDLGDFFSPYKKKYFQTSFYKQSRIKQHILVDAADQPIGGKWSFDDENRKKYPKQKVAPKIESPLNDPFWSEALTYIETNYADNPGNLTPKPFYPIDGPTTQKWLAYFFEHRFEDFGTYEDAIVKDELFLNHSVLSPMLNIGLISPKSIIDAALLHAKKADIPLNSLEGFIRQIMGWREFIRGMYISQGSASRSTNYWGFKRKIPSSFYTATTGIYPIDQTIQKILKTGYCHHIERLMVLGNFMVLCEFDPDEVYRWFMELFIDAYDWVMVPNVYGMSQFADGGLFATKPYISGSNYLMKMSDYSKGDWQPIWDALFWRFMDVHRLFFIKNPRLGLLIKTFDKMEDQKKNQLHTTANQFLNQLNA
jgi:deoxyribodipyrimidine photolyase-related protein